MSSKAEKPSKKQILKAKADFEALRKKAVDTLLWEQVPATGGEGKSAAPALRPRDLLADFAPFRKFNTAVKEGDGAASSPEENEIEISFTAMGLPSWTPAVETAVFEITKKNMKDIYDTASGSGKWKWNDTKKRGELFVPELRFIVATLKSTGEVVGFLAFRLDLIGDYEVFYVMEVHTTDRVRRKGLGQRLMQIGELIARKNGLQWMMLTVLKNNPEALSFYRSKLRYGVDDMSPSANGDTEAAHEILSKPTYPAGVEAKKAIFACFEEGKLPTPEMLAAPGATVHVRKD